MKALITGFHPQLPGTAPFLSSQGVLNSLPGCCLATVPSPPAPPHFSPLELGCAASPGRGSQGMENPGLSGLGGAGEGQNQRDGSGWAPNLGEDPRPMGKGCLDQPLILKLPTCREVGILTAAIAVSMGLV